MNNQKCYYVYQITNLIDGKKYIGQHYGRVDDSYLGSGLLIMAAVRKYGAENFKKEILCICESREEASKQEINYIQETDAINSSEYYNLAGGGYDTSVQLSNTKWRETHPEEAAQVFQKNWEHLQQWWREHPEKIPERNIQLREAHKQWRKNASRQELEELNQKLQAGKKKWQQEHPVEHQQQVDQWRQAGSLANSQPVRCITTNMEFPSLSAAGRYYNVPQANISKVLAGERHSAGKDPETHRPLLWEKIEKKS